jgi:hypothetical protein
MGNEEKISIRGIKDSDYKACVDGLGLLEGEEIRLRYGCARRYFSRSIAATVLTGSGERAYVKKGLLVFTNYNMIFMEQEGRGSYFAQALRVPLEHISGVISGGTALLFKYVKISVGISGATEQHEFVKFFGTKQSVHEIRAEIEKLLKEVRQEKKRLAQEALARGTLPAMIFCKYCGARNKADQTKCANCGAVLT